MSEPDPTYNSALSHYPAARQLLYTAQLLYITSTPIFGQHYEMKALILNLKLAMQFGRY